MAAIHGLDYDKSFLDALPRTATDDIPILTATQFDALHHSHILSHPPDSVLFPFLHGIEGDNEVQNIFFATQGQQCSAMRSSGQDDGSSTRKFKAKVPRYRALTWVICEEDLENPQKDLKVIVHRKSLESCSEESSEDLDDDEEESDDIADVDLDGDDERELDGLTNDDDEDDDEASSESDSLLEHVSSNSPMNMQVDIACDDAEDDVQGPISMAHHHQVVEIVDVGRDEKHMHPVQHRAGNNNNTDGNVNNRGGNMNGVVVSPSSGYSSTEESGNSESDEQVQNVQFSSDSSFDTTNSKPPLPHHSTSSSPSSSTRSSTNSSPQPRTRRRQQPHPSPPILTSTFRARELLRRVPVPKSDRSCVPENDQCHQQCQQHNHKTFSSDSSSSDSPKSGSPNGDLGLGLDLGMVDDNDNDNDNDNMCHCVAGSTGFSSVTNDNCNNSNSVDILDHACATLGAALDGSGSGGGGGGGTGGDASCVGNTSRLGDGDSADQHRNRDQDGEDDEGGWEFLPLKVPEGISLRNFGIQVPIVTTLSDIIIYSPTPSGAAKSAKAIKLAKRFRQALRRKWVERVGGDPKAQTNLKPEDLPLEYNVFVLDATAEDIRRDLPHLVARPCKEGEVPGSLSTTSVEGLGTGGIENVGSMGMGCTAAERDGDGDVVMSDSFTSPFPSASSSRLAPSSSTSSLSSSSSASKINVVLSPNTVDFAQRERDEWRDLTRASEIISVFPEGHARGSSITTGSTSYGDFSTSSPVEDLRQEDELEDEDDDLIEDQSEDEIDFSTTQRYWDPTVGQVFLGNANDVPLPVGDRTEWELEYDTLVGTSGSFSGSSSGLGRESRDVYAGIDWRQILNKEKEMKSGAGSVKGNGKGKRKGTTKNSAHETTYARPVGNAPIQNYGYDICIECHEQAPFSTLAHLKAAEQKIALLEETWKQRVERERERLAEMKRRRKAEDEEDELGDLTDILPPRPAPHPNSVIHLPMPGSPLGNTASVNAIMPLVRFLQKCLEPAEPVKMRVSEPEPELTAYTEEGAGQASANAPATASKGRRWSSVSSLMAAFPSFAGSNSTANSGSASPPPPPAPSPAVSRQRSFTSPAPRSPSSSPSRRSDSMTTSHSPRRQWSRPLKVLVYSSDGYTESSLLALCILMAFKSLDLPHAYLELQVEKRRSFFVYQMDLGLLRRVEDVLADERRKEREERERKERERREKERMEREFRERERMEWEGRYSFVNGSGHLHFGSGSGGYGDGCYSHGHSRSRTLGAHSGAKSVSFARGHGYGPDALPSSSSYALGPPMSSSLPSLPSSTMDKTIDGRIGGCKIGRRPRASTSPWLPSLFGGDHQNWFNDHRFDGSFPSRVLPFLYLGNLNHASNVYMLQALGITHVVSVGECALVPPSNQHNGRHFGSSRASGHGHFISGKSDHQGSLWIEERAGRIKVLDIQGVCDDGIDTLEPQLEPICDWIDEARQEGGQVLVHCRVGVSRSATVTIAYVMKHLSLPLVDAYLIVRSRRLSVLIQPNMRLLYNLLGWEIKLAKERAGNDERKLRYELSSALSWPYLAREVHALNEKYLR